jgi:outer membrane protein TolC
MKKLVLITYMLVLLSPAIWSQKIITLKDCYEKAMANTPLAKEPDIYNSILQLKDQNLMLGWLPSIDANASVLYNSEVADISSALGSLPIPGIAEAISPLPHDQYKFTIDINQVIYDGGAIKNARLLEEAGRDINGKQTEVELYKIRTQINSYYFGILLLDSQRELLDSYLAIIDKRLSSMNSALANGMILKSDIDVITSEKIKLKQQIVESDIRKNALLELLSDITGENITSSKELVIPVQTDETIEEILRPELQLFDLRNAQLGSGLKIIESKRKPKAFGFATLGYGNPPGSNFFKDEFAPYYIMGAGIKWNIYDWNRSKNDKKEINLQQQIIEGKKTDLSNNLKRMLQAKKAEIESLKSLVESDLELMSLKNRITLAAESQYENGTITATEYLNELNSEQQAGINHEIHKINLALARIEYRIISGKDID